MTIETANRLFELRKKHNLSQEELAEKLGVSRQAVSKWERSEASPDTDNLIALAKIYNLSLDELIYGEKTESVEENKSAIDIDESSEDCYNNENDDAFVIEGKLVLDKPNTKSSKFWFEMPYPIICTVVYLVLGACNLLGGWHPAWIIFVTIPVYYSLVESIYNKKFSSFAYPVFAAFLFLVFGCYFDNWHPSWIIFVTVPIYYSIAAALDKRIKSSK